VRFVVEGDRTGGQAAPEEGQSDATRQEGEGPKAAQRAAQSDERREAPEVVRHGMEANSTRIGETSASSEGKTGSTQA
jgi:hypothetical protein